MKRRECKLAELRTSEFHTTAHKGINSENILELNWGGGALQENACSVTCLEILRIVFPNNPKANRHKA